MEMVVGPQKAFSLVVHQMSLNYILKKFVIIMFLIGPILDTASLFLIAAELTKPYIIATYISGLPVNAVHAAATALTLYFFSQPLFEKLDRLKTKYGMMEG